MGSQLLIMLSCMNTRYSRCLEPVPCGCVLVDRWGSWAGSLLVILVRGRGAPSWAGSRNHPRPAALCVLLGTYHESCKPLCRLLQRLRTMMVPSSPGDIFLRGGPATHSTVATAMLRHAFWALAHTWAPVGASRIIRVHVTTHAAVAVQRWPAQARRQRQDTQQVWTSGAGKHRFTVLQPTR